MSSKTYRQQLDAETQAWREVYLEQGATVGEQGEIVFPVEWVEAEAQADALRAEIEAEVEASDKMLDVLTDQIAEESERATRAWAGYVRTVEECGRKSVEAGRVLQRYNEVSDRLVWLEYQARSLVK